MSSSLAVLLLPVACVIQVAIADNCVCFVAVSGSFEPPAHIRLFVPTGICKPLTPSHSLYLSLYLSLSVSACLTVSPSRHPLSRRYFFCLPPRRSLRGPGMLSPPRLRWRSASGQRTASGKLRGERNRMGDRDKSRHCGVVCQLASASNTCSWGVFCRCSKGGGSAQG